MFTSVLVFGQTAAIVAEAQKSTAYFVPQVKAQRRETPLHSERLFHLHFRVISIALLEPVVRYERKETMEVMDPIVAEQPAKELRHVVEG